jgi:glycosyltransferase involved in cell wall biosynthesis
VQSKQLENLKMIYIIAPNIKIGGGKELLEYLLEYINKYFSSVKVVVYLDSSMQDIKETGSIKVVYLDSIMGKVALFAKRFENALYFGNLPPLVRSSNSIVYFHNTYLLMPFYTLKRSSFKFILKYTLQQLYIKYFIRNVDLVAVQNQEIKNNFISKYKYSKVELLPFFRLCDQNNTEYKIYDFCYVSLAHPHKNHNHLIDALDILSSENISVNLALTIEDGHEELIEKINKLNEKGIVRIDNLGLLSKEDVCKLYAQSKCLVFPSTQETFGLALIESVKMGLDAIVADLDYVYQSIKPSLVFNPNDANDIASKMKMYMNGDVEKSEIIIDNKIDQLIKFFIKEKNV